MTETATPRYKSRRIRPPEGATPYNPIQKQHPKLTAMQRLKVKSLSDFNPEGAVRTLESLGFETRPTPGGQYAIRKGAGDRWHVVDPATGFFSRDFLADVGDVSTDVAVRAPAAAMGGLKGASMGSALGPFGAIGGGILGAAGGAGAAELGLQGAGRLAGYKATPGEIARSVGVESAIGGVAEGALRAAGGAVRGLGRKLRGKPRPEVGPLTTQERLVASQAAPRGPVRDVAGEAQERMLRQKLEIPAEEEAAREARLREFLARRPPPEAPGPAVPVEPPRTPPGPPTAAEAPRHPSTPFHGAEERYPAKRALPGVQSSPQEEMVRARMRRMDEGSPGMATFVKRTAPAKGQTAHERRVMRFRLRPRFQVRGEVSREALDGLSEKELREAALDWHIEAEGRSRAQLIDDLLSSGKEPGLGPWQAPLKGKARAYEPEEKNLRWVWDLEKRGWRSIPLDQVETLVTTQGGKRQAWLAVRRSRGVGRAGYPRNIESPAGRGAPFGKEPKPVEPRLAPEIERAAGKEPPAAGALRRTAALDPGYDPAARVPEGGLGGLGRTGPLRSPGGDIGRGSSARLPPKVKPAKAAAEATGKRGLLEGTVRYGLRSASGRTGRRLGAALVGSHIGGPIGGFLGYLGMRGAETAAEGGAAAVKAKIRSLIALVPEAIGRKLRVLEKLDPKSARWRATLFVLLRDPAFKRWAEEHPEVLSQGSEGGTRRTPTR